MHSRSFSHKRQRDFQSDVSMCRVQLEPRQVTAALSGENLCHPYPVSINTHKRLIHMKKSKPKASEIHRNSEDFGSIVPKKPRERKKNRKDTQSQDSRQHVYG